VESGNPGGRFSDVELRELAERFVDDDPARWGDRDAAHEYLRRMANCGDPRMLWQVAAFLAARYSGRFAAPWQREAIATEWRDSGVTVDENSFPLFGDGGTDQDFSVLVRGEPDEAVRAALEAARPRLFCTGSDGIEYPDGDAALEAWYNPNFVSDPDVHPSGGWEIWMDCKDGAYPLMAATQLRILVEELRTAGVTSIHIGPVPGREHRD
jgi:hypothetical protein